MTHSVIDEKLIQSIDNMVQEHHSVIYNIGIQVSIRKS